jgi:hypothetical protein
VPSVGSHSVLREEYVGRALTLLRQALDAGYHAGKDLRTDDAFELLRGRPEFRQIVKRFEAKGPARSGGRN